MIKIEQVTNPSYVVGESPVWRAAEAALYWVDIPSKLVCRLQVETGIVDTWSTAAMVGCIAFNREGTLIAGMEDGIYSLSLSPGMVNARQLAAPAFPTHNMRFNDGRCDRQGRFWAGTMHMDMAAAHPVGSLYRYAASNGLSSPMESGLLTQNGLAWSPAGGLMYLSDSHPKVQLVWVFDYDADTGTPHNRRLFVDMNLHPGRPDGAAVDVDGCYWTCANDAGQLLRFTPAGILDRSISLPVKKPTMCAFGGTNFDTLYVTSIRPQNDADLTEQPLAGAVFALRPGIQGLPETEFGGTG
ncbi:MAG: SMP-30/gluconolactonase/LRE family protein [Prolixibacteraceae bacterium]|nr:SMP-30/gluconolactonase/LRE family protein [Burkholderiales bacterium]